MQPCTLLYIGVRVFQATDEIAEDNRQNKLFTFKIIGFMNYFSYVHKTFGAVSMRVNTWEIPSLLMVIADLNKNGEVISHVATKSV
jgi:hypothetical protein